VPKLIMQKRDKIKMIIALSLVLMMAITYYFFGKESLPMKTAAGFSLLFWIATMIYVNRKFK
jgi:hypothetical protein